MSKPAPAGPLLGDELARAIHLLTEKQLRAYSYWREGHALNWIATRLGVSRPRVVHLLAAAEKKLGYEPTVTAKKKTPYKPVVQRRAEAASALVADARELAAALPPRERRIFERSRKGAVCQSSRNLLLVDSRRAASFATASRCPKPPRSPRPRVFDELGPAAVSPSWASRWACSSSPR